MKCPMAQHWELSPAQENEQLVTEKNEIALKMRHSIAQNARAIENLESKVRAQTEERTRKGIVTFHPRMTVNPTVHTPRPLGQATASKSH